MTQVALVTGGGSGIGRMSAGALAKAGFTVVVCGRNLTTLEETVSMYSDGSITAVTCDVTDPDSVDQLIAEIVGAHE